MIVKEAEARLAALLDRINASTTPSKPLLDRHLYGCVQFVGSHNRVIVHMHCASSMESFSANQADPVQNDT